MTFVSFCNGIVSVNTVDRTRRHVVYFMRRA